MERQLSSLPIIAVAKLLSLADMDLRCLQIGDMLQYRTAVYLYFVTAMPIMINDLTLKCDISDVPLNCRDLCRPLPLVINVLDTGIWHGDPYFG